MGYPTNNANLNTSISGSTSQSGVHAQHHDALATEINALEQDLLAGGALRTTIDSKANASDVPAASTSVVAQTAFGASSAVGSAATFSRGDHAHGTPPAPTSSSTFESFGGAVGGSATVQANAVGAARSWLSANPGGEVTFGAGAGAGVYGNMPQFELPISGSRLLLKTWSTVLQPKPNLNTDFIINHVSTNGTTDPNAEFCEVVGGKLDGNKANQTGGHAIHFNNNPASSDISFDMQHLVRRCWIYNAKQDGVRSEGHAANIVADCRIDACDGYGVTAGFDTWLNNLNIGGSGLAGVNFGAASPGADINNFCSNVASFYSGAVTASSGAGWVFSGNRNNGARLSSCGAQDNKAYGYQFVNNSFVTMAGCVADSNSTSSAGTYAALDLWSSNDNIIDCICQDRNGGNTQLNAIQVRTASTGNTINLRHRGVAGSTVSAPVQSWSADSLGNAVSINNYGFGGVGQQAPAFAASFTPDPTAAGTIILGALTAAITINAVAAGNQWPGQRLRFHLTQDATGGRAITWNAAYHLAGGAALPTTASKRNVIEFEWDATLAAYVESFRSTGI